MAKLSKKEKEKNYDYEALEQLTADVLDCIKQFKIDNDDILVKFSIEVTNRNTEEEEPPKGNKKRKKIK